MQLVQKHKKPGAGRVSIQILLVQFQIKLRYKFQVHHKNRNYHGLVQTHGEPKHCRESQSCLSNEK